jgi:hypothetical protein
MADAFGVRAVATGSRVGALSLAGLLVCILLSMSPGPAHALAISRGQQNLNISYQDCLARAHQSFVAEGYNANPSRGEGFVAGFKANHGGYINCMGIPNAPTSVIIVIASEGVNDANVPGNERVRLQQRMAQQTPPPPTPPPPTTGGSASLTGRWTFQGAFWDIIQQGSAFRWTRPNSSELGQGTIAGDDVQASWTGGASTTGRIIRDANGNPRRIEWKNGVNFERQ